MGLLSKPLSNKLEEGNHGGFPLQRSSLPSLYYCPSAGSLGSKRRRQEIWPDETALLWAWPHWLSLTLPRKQRNPITYLPRSGLGIPGWMIDHVAILWAVLFGYSQITGRAERSWILGLKSFARDLEEHRAKALYIQTVRNQDKEMPIHGETAEVNFSIARVKAQAAVAKEYARLPADPLPHIVLSESPEGHVGSINENARGEIFEMLFTSPVGLSFPVVHEWTPFSPDPGGLW
jgi:hypothetical protein